MVFDVPFVAACLATLAVNMHGSHNKRPLSSIDREERGHPARDNSSSELGGSRRREGKRHQGGRCMLKHVARALADLTNAYLSSYWPYLCIAYVSFFGTYFFCIMNQDQSPSSHSHGHGRDFEN